MEDNEENNLYLLFNKDILSNSTSDISLGMD
jgi:hypothetical protein